MSALRKKYYQLLQEEMDLISILEILERAGDEYEARSVQAEIDVIHNERMILKQRMRFRVVQAG